MNRHCLQIFAKAPIPGRVKTRMQPVLSPIESAQLAKQLLETTLDHSEQLADCDRQLWCAPACDHPWLQTLTKNHDLQCFDQIKGDLGRRMWHALNQGIKNHQAVVLIGSDCPFLTTDYLSQTFLSLQQKKTLVISPANDGGYVLIGSNQPVPRTVFEQIHWGSNTVLEETLYQLKKAAIEYTLHPALDDIDRPEDLRLLKPKPGF